MCCFASTCPQSLIFLEKWFNLISGNLCCSKRDLKAQSLIVIETPLGCFRHLWDDLDSLIPSASSQVVRGRSCSWSPVRVPLFQCSFPLTSCHKYPLHGDGNHVCFAKRECIKINVKFPSTRLGKCSALAVLPGVAVLSAPWAKVLCILLASAVSIIWQWCPKTPRLVFFQNGGGCNLGSRNTAQGFAKFSSCLRCVQHDDG